MAMAMERNPAVVDAMKSAGWEIASHGYRWIDYQFVEEPVEREHMRLALKLHESLTGAAPDGWYLGRCSPQSMQIAKDEGDFVYCADSYADDLPYWDYSGDKTMLMVPYTLDCNDMRFATAQGFNTGVQFFDYLKDTFDTLYAEGADSPKMMSVGLHCRLAGRPGRAAAVEKFLDYIETHENVWVTRRVDIANHWIKQNPAERA